MKALAVVVALVASAHADDTTEPPRPVHGSAGVGTSFLVTGDLGDRNRFDAEVDLEPGGRFGHYGMLVALRGFDDHHAGLLVGGLMFEAAAARPRLVLDLHADAGADLDTHRPLAGGGVRTLLGIIGPLAIGFDVTACVVIAGAQDTRLVFAGDSLLVLRW